MENRKKTYTLAALKDRYIGAEGTPKRTAYEGELRMEIIGEQIKQMRLSRKLTQSALGELVGVQKAQISKLENNVHQVTIATLIKVFKALDAEVHFSVRMEKEVME